jgi:Ca-activated chloride channel family protein
MQSCFFKLSFMTFGLALYLAQPAVAWQTTQPTPRSTPAPQNPPAKPEGKSETTVAIAPAGPATASGADLNKVKSSEDGTIKVSVNEVIVPVTVTDGKGRFVSDLDKSDFQIFEEDRPQTMTFFTRERNQPVVIGFLLDMSTASNIHWKNFQNATEELIQNLLTGDPKYSGYLIDYAQDAEVAVDTSSDPEPMVEKVRKLKPGGGSALYDAIWLACTSRKLIQGEPIEPRRVLVIIGDGHDNASKHSLAQVLELASRNQFTIYCISTQAFGFTNESDQNLVKLSTETGGRTVYPLDEIYRDTDGYLSKPSDDGNYALTVGTGAYMNVVDGKMYKAVADIAGEITTQYIIRYVSDNPRERSYRNLKVIVQLGNVRVRARKGYYAGAPGS